MSPGDNDNGGEDLAGMPYGKVGPSFILMAGVLKCSSLLPPSGSVKKKCRPGLNITAAAKPNNNIPEPNQSECEWFPSRRKESGQVLRALNPRCAYAFSPICPPMSITFRNKQPERKTGPLRLMPDAVWDQPGFYP